MDRLAERFPGYGLERNKGYASTEHLDALLRLGYSTAHRLSFQPVRAAIAS
jgi:ribonuclease HII